VIFVLGIAVTASPASGEQMIQFFSGKSLSALCENSVDECTDYIIGVYDTLAMLHPLYPCIVGPRCKMLST
jgi:hypothetical protein